MKDKKYMISEAAKLVDVESHVLRYWEEELHISVNRTQMGHRYYTKEDIQLFSCIKRLKDEGITIKELKILIPQILETREKASEKNTENTKQSPEALPDTTTLQVSEQLQTPEVITDIQLQQVRDLIGNVLNDVVVSNNETLKKDISRDVTANVMREMKFLMQAKDRRDEEHFRKLDIMIRQQQTLRKESANTGPIGKIKRILT